MPSSSSHLRLWTRYHPVVLSTTSFKEHFPSGHCSNLRVGTNDSFNPFQKMSSCSEWICFRRFTGYEGAWQVNGHCGHQLTNNPVCVICRQLLMLSSAREELRACTRRTEGGGEDKVSGVTEKKEGWGITIKTPFRLQ